MDKAKAREDLSKSNEQMEENNRDGVAPEFKTLSPKLKFAWLRIGTP